MKNTIKYTAFSEINQMKLFHYYSFNIPKDDPVLELINILEGLELTNFKKLFQYKTKINPIRLLAVIIYANSMRILNSNIY